jgi:hypothetical protein
MPDGFIEIDLDLLQTSVVRPVVDLARANRKGVIFLSAAPNQPGPWKLQACALSQRATERITRIIREDLGSQK